jgi:hypothetical protein
MDFFQQWGVDEEKVASIENSTLQGNTQAFETAATLEAASVEKPSEMEFSDGFMQVMGLLNSASPVLPSCEKAATVVKLDLDNPMDWRCPA